MKRRTCHGSAFYPYAEVRAVPVGEMRDAQAVVNAAGEGGRPGQSRLGLLRENADVIRGLAQELRQLRGLAVIVTNQSTYSRCCLPKARGYPSFAVSESGV